MRTFFAFLLLALLASCIRNRQAPSADDPSSNIKQFEVLEVIQSSQYTYLRVTENSDLRWVAVSKTDVAGGEKYYYDNALQMTNFYSRELDRTFPVIYFISTISKYPLASQPPEPGVPSGDRGRPAHSGTPRAHQHSAISIPKQEDELTVADIFKNSDQYAGRQVTIRGLVVKVNKQVMGKNWIHIQDGTSYNDRFDLTVTSQDLPGEGEVVTLSGTIHVNKNFGSGFFYEVIMEEARLVK